MIELELRKASLSDLFATWGLHCGRNESEEYCQQIIDEVHHRDHISTRVAEDLWNDGYDAGCKVGMIQERKASDSCMKDYTPKRSPIDHVERVSKKGAAITVDRLHLTDKAKENLSIGNKSFPKPKLTEDGGSLGADEIIWSPTEQESWIEVAAEANRNLDAYLREVMPELPEHYGMPADGVRMVVKKLQKQLEKFTASGLYFERVL